MASSRKSFTDLMLHLHPSSVPAATLRFSLSLGLGGMATTLVGLLLLTGVLLLMVYQPAVGQAYDSIMVLTHDVPFGRFVRNIHHASANLLVVVTVLHLVRVAATGAFCPGRSFNWIIGLALLGLVLVANFTGYLLPWDQLAYWAVTICTSMLGYVPLAGDWLMELSRGGRGIGQPTLANFFVLHVAALPGCLLVLLAWHFWLVRQAGGLVHEAAVPVERVATMPHLLAREAAVGLSLAAFVLLVAIVWDAPILAQANPGMSPNPAKAPWYFQGFQELLLHLHPVFAVFVWPLCATVALVAIPFWPGSSLPPGVWFGSTRGRRLAGWMSVAGLVLMTGAIVADHVVLRPSPGAGADWITHGLAPTLFLLGCFVALYHFLVRIRGYARGEVVVAFLCLVLSSLVVCTVVGVYFRGLEMSLVWHFGRGAGKP